MKFLESSFTDYINNVETYDLHDKQQYILSKIPDDFNKLNNLIIYGPSGIGKYSQVLNIIKKYSLTNMKHEKRVNITFNKKYDYNFKISDIHFEIDMQLLGCNAKTLWQYMYNHIIDIISTKQQKRGIIVCTNFDEIHWELLEIFYKYINIEYKNIQVKFIIVTKNIGFFPDDIINKCELITLPRPTKTSYNKILTKNISPTIKLHDIINIKNIKTDVSQLRDPCNIIGNKLIDQIINYNDINFITLRDNLYDLLIYNINIEETIWFIMSNLFENKYISESELFDIQNKINTFLKLYTNNYRPIFHLEKIILYLCKVVNKL